MDYLSYKGNGKTKMENIKKIEIELESICPILMDKYPEEDKKAKTEEEYRKLAEDKLYKNEKGIFIPSSAIKALIRNASSDLGKKMEGKKNRQTISAGVFFESELYINNKKHDGIVKHIVTRGKGDKVTRVPTYRPIFNKWNGKLRANLIGVNPQFIKECLQLGGLRYGLLGYRPDYGRFVVKNFKEVN